MELLTILLIAIGLSMDAFAVSITSGMAIKTLKIRHILRIALLFGLFQAVMPVIGWLAGMQIRRWIAAFDHWIAFMLLAFIGGKMILEATILESEKESSDPLHFGTLFVLAVATSIDALAVGLSFSFLNVLIAAPAIIIGVVTFAISFAGVAIGHAFGSFFQKKIEIVGGLILIAIGVKILVEHLFS